MSMDRVREFFDNLWLRIETVWEDAHRTYRDDTTKEG
jgi:hypothetical protein